MSFAAWGLGIVLSFITAHIEIKVLWEGCALVMFLAALPLQYTQGLALNEWAIGALECLNRWAAERE